MAEVLESQRTRKEKWRVSEGPGGTPGCGMENELLGAAGEIPGAGLRKMKAARLSDKCRGEFQAGRTRLAGDF